MQIPNLFDSDKPAWATAYARASLAVFPLHSINDGRCTCGKADCGSPGKHPLTKRGLLEATSDPTQVHAWFQRWPWANIGIRTGQASGGLVVLDVDGPEGMAELRALVARFGLLPRSPTARTGRGIHVFFRCDSPVKSSARGKLHVRGEGGYIVASGSLHASGRRYEWIDSTLTIVDLPNFLKEWMTNGSKSNESRTLRGRLVPPYLEGLPDRGLARIGLEAIKGVESRRSPQQQQRIESALATIPADSYET